VAGGPFGGSKAVNATHGSLDTGGVSGGAAQAFASTAEARRKRCKKPKPLVAYLFRPFPLRLTAFSDAQSNIHGHVSIYDGKPGARNTKTIAIKTVQGVTPDGTSSWFSWTPKKKGSHHLYAVIQNTSGPTSLGDVVIYVRRAPGDLNGDGRVDRHDMNMLNRDLGKRVADSDCGESCDLDGDGKITAKDLDLMSQACDSADCSFRSIEYVGGAASAEEPEMRGVRQREEASLAAFRQSAGEVGDAESSEAQLFQAERQRKQSLRSVKYYYRGKPVTQGPFAKR
jgi:hypothetical protein